MVMRDRELTDQEVLDGLFKRLVARTWEHPGILGKMGRQTETLVTLPLWLFRTSVLHYRVRQRASFLRMDHTDLNLHALIEAGKVGPVV